MPNDGGRLAAAALRTERRRGELTLTFVDRAEMTLLNTEHMGEAGPTDVLSFPLDALDLDLRRAAADDRAGAVGRRGDLSRRSPPRRRPATPERSTTSWRC